MLSQIEHIANKLNRIYNISSIPYVIFSDKGVDLLHRPQIRDFYYPCSFLEASYPLVKNNAYPYIIPLQETVYIGMFKTDDYALILGPVSSRPDTNLVDLLIQKEHSANYSALNNVFGHCGPVSLSKFANLLSIVFETCRNSDISPEKILKISNLSIDAPREKTISNFLCYDKEISDLCLFEISLFNIIKSGCSLAIDELRKLKYPPLIRQNIIHAKADSFILLPLLTIMSRAAITGGANAGKVFELYNSAIIDYQKYPSSIEFLDLIFDYAIEFCVLVKEANSTQDRADICNLIERYILWNYNDNITLRDLADYCNLSERQIQRIFSKYFHCSFTEYILKAKIDHAKTLLYSTNQSISDISSSLGFASQSYFTKRFQDVTGQTPSEFRSSKPLL